MRLDLCKPNHYLGLAIIVCLMLHGCSAERSELLTAALTGSPTQRHSSLQCRMPKSADWQLNVNNRARRALISYRQGESRSGTNSEKRNLVIAFHGRTNDAAQVRGYYALESFNKRPTLFIYPEGLPDKSGKFTWWDYGKGPQLRDYAFFDALLAKAVQQLGGEQCLANVFVVGHSLGASFTNSLGCARGDKIRAIGSLGGGIEAGSCSGKVAAMIMHNPNDRLVPVAYGERAVQRFTKHLGYGGPAKATEPRDYQCQRYGGSQTQWPVLWCRHGFDYSSRGRYYPHNWPRGTGAVMMEFFESL